MADAPGLPNESPSKMERSDSAERLVKDSTGVTYFYRWVVLGVFCINSFSNAANWITFSTIFSYSQSYYQVPSIAIDFLSLVYMIVYIPFIFVSSWVLSRFGLRKGLIFGTTLNHLGSWLRYIGSLPAVPVEARYPVVLVGQIICSIAQTFILQVPPLIANDWFPPNQRSLATSIGALWNQLGVAVGFLLAAYIPKAQEDIPLLLLIKSIVAGVVWLAAIAGIRSHPPSPPSVAAAVKSDPNQQYGFFEQLRMMLSKDFILVFFGFGGIMGVFYGLSTVLAQILAPFNYTSDQSGLLGFLITVVGLAGALVAGFAGDKTHRYKQLMLIVNIGCSVTLLWFALIIKPDNFPHMAVVLCLLGFFLTASLPVYMEACAEVAFPVSEDFSTGLIMLIAQVVGIVLVLVMGAMVNAGAHIGAVWLCFAISAVCIILIAVMSPSYKRLAQEKIAKEEADREAAARPTLLSPTTQADQTVLVDPAAQDAEIHRHHKHGHRKHKHRKRHQEDHDEDAMVSDEDLDQEQPATEARLQIGSVEIEEPVKEEKEAEKKKNRRLRKKQHEEEKNVGFDEQTVGGSTKIPQLVMVNSNEPGNQAHVAQDESPRESRL